MLLCERRNFEIALESSAVEAARFKKPHDDLVSGAGFDPRLGPMTTS